MYDVVLLEKHGIDGLTLNEIKALMSIIKEKEVYPIEISAHYVESSAMGFIGAEAANKIDYNYTQLENKVAEIMDDMELENEDGKYTMGDIIIYLSRSIITI